MLPEGGEEEKGVLSIVASLRSVVDAVEVGQAKQVRVGPRGWVIWQPSPEERGHEYGRMSVSLIQVM
jgi:hypothetical protein